MSIAIRAAKGEAEILIYDGIGADFWGDGVTAERFVQDLKDLGSVSNLTVRLNSGGGDVFDGIAIYEAIARHPAKKTVVVDGLAASIASVIMCAGDEIKIAAAGFVMIHNARSFAMGDARELRRKADLLDSVSGQIASVYMGRTNNKAKKVQEWMDAETWFDADSAIAAGFADRKTDEAMKVAASLDVSRFRNMPAALRAAMQTNTRKPPAATPRLDALAARVAAHRA